MKNMLRIIPLTHEVKIGSPMQNMQNAYNAILNTLPLNPDIIVLPALSLTGASCASLFGNSALAQGAAGALKSLCEKTKRLDCFIITSLPQMKNGVLNTVSYVLYKGTAYPAEENSVKALFACGDAHFSVCACNPTEIFREAVGAVTCGADCVIIPSAIHVRAREIENSRKLAQNFSQAFNCAVCLCNGNPGETSAPFVYKSFCGIFECGETLAWQIDEFEPIQACADIDTDIIKAQSTRLVSTESPVKVKHSLNKKSGLLRDVRQNPYLPIDFKEQLDFLEEVFDLQTRSLMGRMKNTGISKLVIGCSGGLDSTLALLVAAHTLKVLELPRENLIGITLPGFGTTGRTYKNSLALIKGVGATLKEISICDAVNVHFKDIGHDGKTPDVTYENAQARERTQILFDIANKENAIVIGTGDLSEAALGWCTFGGDQFANFNVNSCVTKTMARLLTQYLAQKQEFVDIGEILTDILATPVSPELLPADSQGNCKQLTEEILGDYILHDFYLYYFVKYNMPPSRIYAYALAAFKNDFSEEEIHRTLTLFIRRFFSGQFKRSCAPESAAITEICLSNSCFSIPSDASPDFLLSELENNKIEK